MRMEYGQDHNTEIFGHEVHRVRKTNEDNTTN